MFHVFVFSCSVRLHCYCITKTQDCSFAIFRQTHNSIVPIYMCFLYYIYNISQGGHTSLNPLDRVNHTLCQAGEKIRFAMPRRTRREIKQICGPIPTSLADPALPIQKTGIYGSSMGSCIMFIYMRLYKNSCQWKSGVPMFGMGY